MYSVPLILDLTRDEKLEVFGKEYKRGDEVILLRLLFPNSPMVKDVLFENMIRFSEKTVYDRLSRLHLITPSLTWGEGIVQLYKSTIRKSLYPNFLEKIRNKLPERVFLEYREKFLDIMQDQEYHDPVEVYEDINNTLEYVSGANLPSNVYHIGQRKLFLSEVQFFNEINKKDEIVVVYVGAAPSQHTSYLSSLFPNIKFLLIDNARFFVSGKSRTLTAKGKSGYQEYKSICEQFVKNNDRIQIYNNLFYNDFARAVRDVIGDHYFISDIRTAQSDNAESFDIIWNSCQQYVWMKIMKPTLSLLKFRFPYQNKDDGNFDEYVEKHKDDFELAKEFGLDFVKQYKSNNFVYFDGKVNIQCFQSVKSTETRLVTDGTTLKNYDDYKTYDDTFFYFNNLDRWLTLRKNDNASPALGFDHCNDCALENKIWKEYKKKFQSSVSVIDYVKQLTLNTGKRELIFGNHGKLFRKPSEEMLLKIKN